MQNPNARTRPDDFRAENSNQSERVDMHGMHDTHDMHDVHDTHDMDDTYNAHHTQPVSRLQEIKIRN